MAAINLSEHRPLLAEGESVTHHVFPPSVKVLAVCSTKEEASQGIQMMGVKDTTGWLEMFSWSHNQTIVLYKQKPTF